MKNYRCSNCKEEFELTHLYVSKKWYYVKRYKRKWGYFVRCPLCRRSERVNFCKLPFKVKKHFIKNG